MNNPLSVSPSKGNQGTTRGKEEIFWPRWEQGRSHSSQQDEASFERRRREPLSGTGAKLMAICIFKYLNIVTRIIPRE